MSELKEQFDTDGFVIVRGVFDETEAEQLKDETRRILQTEPAYAGVLVGLAARSPVFREAARDPRLVDPIAEVIGPDVEFLSDKVVFKSAEVDFGSPWHQDWPYWRGAHKLSVWVALDAATPENGCLKLLPGSHLSEAVHDGTTEDGNGFGHRLRPGAVDEQLARVVPCAVGDAVIFSDLTLHASCPNTSGKDRWALISTYRSASEPDMEYGWAVAAEIVRGSRTAAV